jgi:adenylate kinase family enzyme
VPLASKPHAARRILVYGVTGSGKSTAAQHIAERTGLPLNLADDFAWEPGWTPVDEQRLRARFAQVAAGDTWVLDTAYGTSLDLVVPRAQLIVALDYPRWFSLQRLVRRSVRRVVTQQPICNGNTESWRLLLSRDSILRWHFRSFARKRQRIQQWAAASDGPPVLVVRRPRALEAFIATLQR